MAEGFVWRDAGRTVVFRAGSARGAADLLDEHGFGGGYELLSTPRALEAGGDLAERAQAVHEVGSGAVADISAELLEAATAERLVALGGGRVVDAAKAIAAITGARVAAVPTTMSGAEMTGIHRLPAGAETRARGLVRPALVLADPDLMTSAPEEDLRASSMNALAHGADSLCTPMANPVSRMLGLKGTALIAVALDKIGTEEYRSPTDEYPAHSTGRSRPDLALGSIFCGYAIDSAGFAIHHVICQTVVAVCGSPHAATNAAVLPHAMEAMLPRAPQDMADLAAALGTEPAALRLRIAALGGGPPGLGDVGADRQRLDDALDAILERPQLAFTPDPPDRDELRRIIDAAW